VLPIVITEGNIGDLVLGDSLEKNRFMFTQHILNTEAGIDRNKTLGAKGCAIPDMLTNAATFLDGSAKLGSLFGF
jgi:hypothetical protein